MASATETLLNGLKAQLAAWFGNNANWNYALPSIERNISIPDEIPDTGAIIIRDGNIVGREYVIGGRTVFYSRAVEIEAYIENANPAARDAAYDLLTSAIGAAIESDTTINGAALGCLYDRDAQDIHPIDGGKGIKSGIIKPVFDYTSAFPLA